MAHDLGRPPFGYTADEALNVLAKNFGGLAGNAQSFRIMTIDMCINNAIGVLGCSEGRTPMPRQKGSADLLEGRRKRALALLGAGHSLNEV